MWFEEEGRPPSPEEFPYRGERGRRWGLQTKATVRRYWGDKRLEDGNKASSEFIVYPYDGEDYSPPPDAYVWSASSVVPWKLFQNVNKKKGWEIVENAKKQSLRELKVSYVDEWGLGCRRSRRKYSINGSTTRRPDIEWINPLADEQEQTAQQEYLRSRLPEKGDDIVWVKHNFTRPNNRTDYVRQDRDSRQRAKYGVCFNGKTIESRKERKQRLRREYAMK